MACHPTQARFNSSTSRLFAIERSQNLRQLFLRLRIIRRGKAGRQLEQQPLPRQFRRQLQPVELVRFLGVFRACRIHHLASIGRDLLGILGNKILFYPGRPGGLHAKIKKVLLRVLDVLPGPLGRWRRFAAFARSRRCLAAACHLRRDQKHRRTENNRNLC